MSKLYLFISLGQDLLFIDILDEFIYKRIRHNLRTLSFQESI